MRFDAVRALALARQFDGARPAGSDAERRAADLVAEHFGRAGLRVERREVVGSRFGERVAGPLGWWGCGVLATFAVALTGSASPWAARLAAALVAPSWALAAFGARLRPGGRLLPCVVSPNVLADRPSAASPETRVVFVTHLDTAPTGRASRTRGRGLLLVLLALVVNLLAVHMEDREWVRAFGASWALVLSGEAVRWRRAGPSRRRDAPEAAAVVPLALAALALDAAALALPGSTRLVGFGLLASIWACVALGALTLAPRRCGPGPAEDNRAGLAALVELARAWSEGSHERIETRFAAIGGPAGACDLARLAREEWPAKPTLFVRLDATDPGPELVLVGGGMALWLAMKAAADLWLPHRLAGCLHDRDARYDQPFVRAILPIVTVVGGEATLAAAVQLATELALRWVEKGRPIRR